MARKSSKQKATVKKLATNRFRQATQDGPPPSLREITRDLMTNRPGFVGFVMSLLQLLGHTTWLLLVWYLSVTGKAKGLNSDSLLSWVIVGILGVSLILTFLSLFLCLFYGLLKSPRLLAAIGFCLSFIVGVLASATVFMTGLRALSGK